MNKENEFKFLVKDKSFIKNAIEARYIQQGYLADNDNCEIRVTVRENNSFICIKSAKCEFSRDEFDYKIPDEEAKELLKKCNKVLYKTRYIVPDEKERTWEVDVFHGNNEGLIIAELEVKNVPMFPIIVPSWVGDEVTGDPKYYNKNIASKV